MRFSIIIAGCVDPMFIFSFLGAAAVAVICGVCAYLVPQRARVPTATFGLAFSLAVFSMLVSDGLFRADFNLFSASMAFGPATLNSVALVLALRSKKENPKDDEKDHT